MSTVPSPTLRRLLWIDSRGGWAVGLCMALAAPWLSALYALPHPLLLTMAAANVAYGSYSGWMLRHGRIRGGWLTGLVAANAAWAAGCVAFAAVWWARATWLGRASLLLEAAVVGGLAWAEWRGRPTTAAAAVTASAVPGS